MHFQVAPQIRIQYTTAEKPDWFDHTEMGVRITIFFVIKYYTLTFDGVTGAHFRNLGFVLKFLSTNSKFLKCGGLCNRSVALLCPLFITFPYC